MKKLLVLLISLTFLAGNLFAGPVSLKRAKAFAEQLIQVDQESFRSMEQDFADKMPAYYLFNARSEQGFVIVSGDDALPLLVAYADRGRIDQEHMPMQLQALLEAYGQRVEELRASNPQPSFRANNVFVEHPREIVAPLTKSLWGQNMPFNDRAPVMNDGIRAAAGCVATSMAQLMYYHRWPMRGESSHAYTPSIYGKLLYVNFFFSRYDWGEMRDEYPIKRYRIDKNKPIQIVKGYQPEEARAVAKLMYDAGVAVDMDYNTASAGGSSSYTYLAAGAMHKYFKYKTKHIERKNCTGDEFIRTIKSELDASRPIIFAGVKRGVMGHAWIVDGYDENGYLHCNWGWAGLANGFFSMNFMVPDRLGTGAGVGEYNDDQEIIIAEPNRDNSLPEAEDPRLSFIGTGFLNYESKAEISKNEAVKVSLIQGGNATSDLPFYGVMGVGLLNKDGRIIRAFEWAKQIDGLEKLNYFPKAEISLSLSRIDDGIYQLYPLSKYSRGEWLPFVQSNTVYIELVDGKVKMLRDTHDIGFELVGMPKEEVRVYINSVGRTRLTIKNLSDQIIEGAKLKMTLMQVTDPSKRYSLELNDLRFYRQETNMLTAEYDLSKFKDLSAGRYKVYFDVLSAGGNQRYNVQNPFDCDYEIEVQDGSSFPVLSCQSIEVSRGDLPLTDYRLSPETLSPDPVLSFIAPVENIGDLDFNGKLYYRLKSLSSGKSIDLGCSQMLKLKKGDVSRANLVYLELDMTSLALEDETYELHLAIKHSDREFDVWNASLKRPVFMVEGFEPFRKEALKKQEEEAEKKRLEEEKKRKEEEEKKKREEAEKKKKEEENGQKPQDDDDAKKKTPLEKLQPEVLKLYPNPFVRKVYISSGYESLSLYSLSGKCVLRINAIQENKPQELDLSHLLRGSYVLSLTKNGKHHEFRLLKL